MISKREHLYFRGVLLVCLLAVLNWAGGIFLEKWKTQQSEIDTLSREISLQERLINNKEEYTERLKSLESQIPTADSAQGLNAKLMRRVQQLAGEHGLNLSRIEPINIEATGELQEIALSCVWSGDLESLLKTIFALQQENFKMDVRRISIRRVSAGKIKGTLELYGVYRNNTHPTGDNS